MAVPVVITAPRGRMGQALNKLASAAGSGFEVVALLDKPGSDIGASVVHSLKDLGAVAQPVVIDFSTPDATMEHIQDASDLGMPCVIGTTGFTTEQRQRLEAHASTVPIIVAPNTSLGVHVLTAVVAQVAAKLKDYDCEIVEYHHRLKKDAPSGTALLLAEAAAAARNVDLGENTCLGRAGHTGVRPIGQIGIHAVRAGDIIGEHTITLAGPGERIELTHKAHSRDTFAAGALEAARYLNGKQPGLYTMRHVLGLD